MGLSIMRPRYTTRRIGDRWAIVDTVTGAYLRSFARLADAARAALELNAAEERGNFMCQFL